MRTTAATCRSTSAASWRRWASHPRSRSRTRRGCSAPRRCGERDAMAAETDQLTFPASLEGWWYTDPAIFATEQRAIYGSRWVCVGRCDDIAEPGAFIVREVGGES